MTIFDRKSVKEAKEPVRTKKAINMKDTISWNKIRHIYTKYVQNFNKL